ncbi:PAS domain S-box protein [Roseofilum casamattae]|uniref:histidine kinase n=1 Tax=Roseofilum casamattae BLCC-M143 TaxID=3022442 RepID=A0ABT7C1A0_9CYAN|nr:PAS domain S-box protein [Roseofilum casamattae]MDJ1185235.1 PAS domain S-box protein [Roseofilum casamattae BLCC-M143]
MAGVRNNWIDRYTLLLESYLQRGTDSPALQEWVEDAIAHDIPLSTLSHWHHRSLAQLIHRDRREEQENLELLDRAGQFQARLLSLWTQTFSNLLLVRHVGGIAIDRRDLTAQKEQEQSQYQQLQFAQLLESLSSQLDRLTAEDLDWGIEEALRELAEFDGCDRAYLFEFNPDDSAAVLRCQWHSPQFGPLPPLWHQIPVELTPWWLQQLQEQGHVCYSSLEDFPDRAKTERAIVSSIPMESSLLLPLTDGSSLLGYIGFATVKERKSWSDDRIAQLQRGSELLTHALQRQRVELTLEHLNEEIDLQIEHRMEELQQMNQQLEAEILERQQMERALRESEARFRSIFEDNPLGIAIINPDYGLERVNAALCRMLGYTTVDCQSLTLLDLLSPEDREVGEMLLERLMTGIIPSFQVKQRFVHHRQHLLWVKAMASAIVSAQPTAGGKMGKRQPVYGVAIIEDITQNKQDEERLQLIQFTLNRVMDSVLLVDARGQLIYVNDRACQTLEYPREELLQMQIGQIDRYCSDAIWSMYWQQVKKYGFIRVDSTYSTRSGHQIPVEINFNFFKYKGLEYGCAIARDLRDRQQAEANLAKSQQLLAAAQKVAGLGSWEFDLSSERIFWSDRVFLIFGRDPTWDCAPTYLEYVEHYHPEDRQVFQHTMARAISEGAEFSLELRIVRPSSEIRSIWVHGHPILDRRGKTIKLFGIIQDITQRKQVEIALRENETRYRTLVSHIPGAIYRSLVDENWTIEFISDAIATITGYSARELMSQTVSGLARLVYPEDLSRIRQEIETALSEAIPFELEYRMVARDGTIHWVYGKGQGVWNEQQELVYLDGAIFDVSDRKKTETQLKASLAEKEVLLREIHHRVKNNLNIVYNLLDMQSKTAEAPAIEELLEDSKKRLETMALIHQKLYLSNSLSHINFAEYIHSLVQSIWASYGARTQGIDLQIEAEPVDLNIETAIPTGLTINELATNALKHAFPEGRSGTVWIKFRQIENEQLDLKVIDDGIGFPSDRNWQTSPSLGMHLVHILAEQLDGKLEITLQNGTIFHLVFKQRC